MRAEVLTAMNMSMLVCREVTLCGLAGRYDAPEERTMSISTKKTNINKIFSALKMVTV
jgi:hypothetical protein